MPFFQSPPALGNTFESDLFLQSLLRRVVEGEVHREILPSLTAMGALCGGPLYELQLADRTNEPRHVPFDPWGRRIDHIEPTPLWRRAERIAAEEGLVAIPWERRHGRFSRLHQMALVLLFEGSSDIYTCPLAMSDGAVKTLRAHGNRQLEERAIPRLISRDPATVWTSGQWMTERTGGSDVGRSETVARQLDGRWRLWGTKWFTSAASSQMALTLARPEGNGPGGRGLALFYVETKDEQGRLADLAINRLKEKLGTRKLPTAELELLGTPAIPVAGLEGGVKAIAPMLNVTRTWNAVSAVGEMQRAVQLANDYARRRVAFGAPLMEKPLHRSTLAWLQAEYALALHLTFYVVELLGREEAGELREREASLLRACTPLAKLCTGRQAVQVASETLEAFGGAGYIEDTGIPRLLRDAQVLSIWEGTTNVLSLDLLKTLGSGSAMGDLVEAIGSNLQEASDPSLVPAVEVVASTVRDVQRRCGETDVEADARGVAMALGRALGLSLLLRHAQWELGRGEGRAAAACRILAARGIAPPEGGATDDHAAVL